MNFQEEYIFEKKTNKLRYRDLCFGDWSDFVSKVA
ncbi:hypothetical protein FlaCF_3415 [Flavobacterium tructae]